MYSVEIPGMMYISPVKHIKWSFGGRGEAGKYRK